MDATIVYQAKECDLKAALAEMLKENIEEKFYSRFYGVFFNAKEVAKIHGVSPQTVLRYIHSGAIKPDVVEGQSYSFRLSEALRFDFSKLRRESSLSKTF